MTHVHPDNPTDDLAQAVRENRPLRPGARFRVQIGNEALDFEDVFLDDPVVLGRQLIEAVGAHPVAEFAAIAWLSNGDFEDLRLDEPFDLRAHGAERVLVVRSDRSFRFQIDDQDLEWPYACVSGAVLRRLAELPANYNLWREVPGGHDVKIQDTDVIRLDEPGVERFISLIDQTTEGVEPLPPDDRDYLERAGAAYQVVTEGGQTGVIVQSVCLPPGKFSVDAADLLILLPSGYPDCAPDMFYTTPRLTLIGTGALPKAANAQHHFGGRVWQRWSRHNAAWRAGIDSLRTMIARAMTALERA